MASQGKIAEYLERHQLQAVLHRMANEVAKNMPDDPLDFMIDHLLALERPGGRKPALIRHLRDVRELLAADKLDADKEQLRREELEKENDKLSYRVSHLCKTLDEMEAGTIGGGGDGKAVLGVGGKPMGFEVPALGAGEVPIGHSAFSWAGGVQGAVAGAEVQQSADPATLEREPFSDRVRISRLLTVGKKAAGREVVVCGWVKTNRKQKDLNFIALNDGSCLASVQVVVDASTEGRDPHATGPGTSTGASMRIVGNVVESPGSGQEVEIKASKVELIGPVPDVYPMAKKDHTLEHLRDHAHLRPRTNTLSAVLRVRNALAFATHDFFQKKGFVYIHTPIVTASDCEGAGEMFQVTTHKLEAGKAPAVYKPEEDFFAKATYLTVSGQLNGEYCACALGSIYTFGPTFRAEASHTARHLAEFWMIEPEIAFADLQDDMNLAEAYLKHCFAHVLGHCQEDLAFLQQHYDRLAAESGADKLQDRLREIVETPFQRVSYTEAVEMLSQVTDKEWEYKPKWGEELQTEHERYLCEHIFKKPTIVHDYPKGCKAFYMRLNDDQKTVAAMDVLFPKVGEMVGGSQREERLDVLLERMREQDLDEEAYKAYIDMRRCGTQKHAGFGVGFERLVLFATSMDNIRDVIPFPRWHGNAHF